jgi:hypothetical protein
MLSYLVEIKVDPEVLSSNYLNNHLHTENELADGEVPSVEAMIEEEFNWLVESGIELISIKNAE